MPHHAADYRTRALSSVNWTEALLISKAGDKSQSNSEPSHVLVAEAPDLLPDPFG
jgi:hypothetical protein